MPVLTFRHNTHSNKQAKHRTFITLDSACSMVIKYGKRDQFKAESRKFLHVGSDLVPEAVSSFVLTAGQAANDPKEDTVSTCAPLECNIFDC